MKYNHVQLRNTRYVWRLNILGHRLTNQDEQGTEITFTLPVQAAYSCDLVKHYIRERFGFRTPKTEMSLPPEQFAERAVAAGLDLNLLSSVYTAMPDSAREFLENGGAELLSEEQARAAAMPQTASPAYLRTLLVATSSRLTESLTALHRARTMKSLTPEVHAALAGLDVKLTEFEQSTRAEIERILSL